MTTLFIVEGAGKIKTLREFQRNGEIPKDVDFAATGGHFREIHGKKDGHQESLAVDFRKQEAKYRNDPEKKDLVENLKVSIKKAKKVVVATDPDNEGHVIAEHIRDTFSKELKGKIYRSFFQELTAAQINNALKTAIPEGGWNWELSAAPGLTRAMMDRTIGWCYSPILRRYLYKMYKGLSAGRVQTPALRMIYERETEIENHKSSAYYQIFADLEDGLFGRHHQNGAKGENDTRLHTKETSDRVLTNIEVADKTLPKPKEKQTYSDGAKIGVIELFEEGQRYKNPPAPFKKATLLDAAAGVLKFSVKKTEEICQRLYQDGYFTYPRGDTVKMSDEVLAAAHQAAKQLHPKDTQDVPVQHEDKGKAKVQEGHCATTVTTKWITVGLDEAKEAILSAGYDEDYCAVYELVWRRTIASQMKPALFDTQKLTVDIKTEKFIVTSEQCIYKGYLNVYSYQDTEEGDEETINSGKKLSGFKKGEQIKVGDYTISAHETKPPARYNEKSLMKKLESEGIGRPSTFKSIIETLKEREYVETIKSKGGELKLKDDRFYITGKGRSVIELILKENLDVADYGYTSMMEEGLDALKEDRSIQKKLLGVFFSGVEDTIAKHDITIDKDGFVNIGTFSAVMPGGEPESSAVCPKCGGGMTRRPTKFGVRCFCDSKNCGYTMAGNEETTDRVCPKCGKYKLTKGATSTGKGRIKCPGGAWDQKKKTMAGCDYIEWVNDAPAEDDGVGESPKPSKKGAKPKKGGKECPKCSGDMAKRKSSKTGKPFWGCNNFPKCNGVVWID